VIGTSATSPSVGWFESENGCDPAWCQLRDRLWIRGLTRRGTALAFVALRGELAAHCADVITLLFSELQSIGVTSLYLDVAELELLDEAGLRALAVAAGEFEARQGRLRVRCPSAWLTSALERTGLGRLMLPST
jgi:anti-anti-sigma factor